MMKLYLIFTKKGLAVILALMVLALIIIGQFSTINNGFADGGTHRERMEFLFSHKISVNETASVQQTRLPQKCDGYFWEYSQKMLRGGFKLSEFCGKTVIIYSYTMKNDTKKTVNLMVFDGKIISVDITDNLKGTVEPLTKEK